MRKCLPLNHAVLLKLRVTGVFPPYCVSEVCPGTQNGLSSTGSQENQYNLIKDRYDGCEIIMGNLEITQIESNWDFSFLKVLWTPSFLNPSFLVFNLLWMNKLYTLYLLAVVSCRWSSPSLQTIREVTGYILIVMNHFQEIPLGQLRIIRGNSLYERRFALSVFFNYPKDGSSGLRQLGLANLTGEDVQGPVCFPVNYWSQWEQRHIKYNLGWEKKVTKHHLL